MLNRSRRSSEPSVVNAPVAVGQPVRILLLSDSFLPHAGGSREYYNNMYRELVALGRTEVLVLTKKVPGWKEFDQKPRNPRFQIRRRFKPLPSWKYQHLAKGIGPFVQALYAALSWRPDIVHAGDLYPQGMTAYLLKRVLGIPYIIYCHGEEITQTDRYRFQPRVRNRIYANADAVIANAEFAKQELLRIGVEERRIHKVTPGVDSKRFGPNPAPQELVRQYKLEGKTIVLTVARLVARKGHRASLKAFATICKEFPLAHYLIAGTGPEESRIRQLIEELGLQDRVTMMGFVPSDRLPDLYNLCDFMVLANRQESDGDIEGFGIVFLEANAAGRPVIGGRSGGTPEAIRDGVTGYLVNPNDHIEIAAAMRSLLSNPALRQSMGRAGRSFATGQFDWTARAQMLERIDVSLLRVDERLSFASSLLSNTQQTVFEAGKRASSHPDTPVEY